MRDRTSKIDVKRPFQTTMMDMIVGDEAAILHPAVERPVAERADQNRITGGGNSRPLRNLTVLGMAMSMPLLGSAAIQ
jgi:hypothetical protein